MKLVKENSAQIDEITMYLKIYELHKSYLLCLSNKKEMGIGDVTLGTPSKIEGVKSSSSTFNLFGMHSDLISSVVAKKSAFILDKPVLVLFFCTADINENTFVKPLVSFLNRTLNELSKKKDNSS